MTSRTERVKELEGLPEVSSLAKSLKDALLEMASRLQQKQKVLEAYGNTGAFALFVALHATVAGIAFKKQTDFGLSSVLL